MSKVFVFFGKMGPGEGVSCMSELESLMSTSRFSRAKTGVSWMALVAATSLGAEGFESVTARVTTDPIDASPDSAASQRYRLVVQAYAPGSLPTGEMPSRRERPLASAQRTVTAEELRDGVALDVMQLGGEFRAVERPTVFAWLEPGEADLEFQGLDARPGEPVLSAVAEGVEEDRVDLVLRNGSARV